MVGRASAIVLALAALVTSGSCSPHVPASAPPPTALHLTPACDLAPSAGLEWVVDAKPRALATEPDLIPIIGLLIPETRFDAFTRAHGGVDMRQMQELCVGKYKETFLSVARVPLDAARVERGFAERVTKPGGRQVVVPNPPVVRVWGEVNGEAQQLLLFGQEEVALEQGKSGPIRAAEAFALGKLRRASPALRATSLRQAVQRVGEAPVRAFSPGPFSGDTADALGGLMRASTAVGASARFVGGPGKIAVRVVLVGAWGKDAAAAGERLAAAAHVVAESPFGRLLGLDHPIVAPEVRTEDDALVIEATIDGVALARGLHDAVDAEIGEIMRR